MAYPRNFDIGGQSKVLDPSPAETGSVPILVAVLVVQLSATTQMMEAALIALR